MTVAGVQNLSVLDSSFHRESQSPLSRQWGSHDRPSTRASSLLQMWRKLEGEHVASYPQLRVEERPQHGRIDDLNSDRVNAYLSEKQDGDDGTKNTNECETWSQGQMGLHNEHEDGNSSSSELSTGFREVKTGRVRQIFQELMNSAVRGHASNVSSVNSYSRGQWLGENECERVRIVRECVIMTSQQRGMCAGSREEQTSEIGAQIERVRDGFVVVNHCEIGTQRNIRRLHGRQALLDLLARAERERKTELQTLSELRPVSNFAHRNRIQSLLRGRFLRSGRLIQNETPSSLAASELGLLRQRHSVSGLREGFLSGPDNFVNCPSRSSQSDNSCNNEINDFRIKQTQTYCSMEELDAIEEQTVSCNGERDINELQTVPLEGLTDQDINWQEATASEERMGIFRNEESERPPSSNSVCIGRNGGGSCGENIASAWSQEASRNEVFREQNEPIGEGHDVNASSNHTDDNESSLIEGMRSPHTFVQIEEWQESVTDNNDSEWQWADNIELTGQRDDNVEGRDGNWSERTANQWYEDTLGSEGEEYDTLQEFHEGWHDNNLHVDMDNLLEGPSARQAAPVERFDAFSFQDDDNVYSSEIRELLSRRSVSNLLRSDFRESLDHLLQSYVERQASVDWELDGASPSSSSPALVERDVWQSGGQNQGQLDAAERAPLVLPSPPVTPSRSLQDDNWSRNNLQQHLEIEWETINDLRIDMARLQQRMNMMQRMLEACMDMQLELQRSVRQEISAALNRSACSTEKDEFRWDHARKELCCIYCENSIDSLLYRCGHMCTCSKCADKLVQGKGKCPMCRAPVVEMIRSYSIQ